jgi:hypothetical protein
LSETATWSSNSQKCHGHRRICRVGHDKFNDIYVDFQFGVQRAPEKVAGNAKLAAVNFPPANIHNSDALKRRWSLQHHDTYRLVRHYWKLKHFASVLWSWWSKGNTRPDARTNESPWLRIKQPDPKLGQLGLSPCYFVPQHSLYLFGSQANRTLESTRQILHKEELLQNPHWKHIFSFYGGLHGISYFQLAFFLKAKWQLLKCPYV